MHRDLAARNVLVSETFVYKIADFGLSRVLAADSAYYRIGVHSKVPLRWSAIEVLKADGKWSTFSDVWSFGILMYEVFTHGKLPYIDLSDVEVLAMLHDGQRLRQPYHDADFPPELFRHLIEPCWNSTPTDRPSFAGLKRWLAESGPAGSLDRLAGGSGLYTHLDEATRNAMYEHIDATRPTITPLYAMRTSDPSLREPDAIESAGYRIPTSKSSTSNADGFYGMTLTTAPAYKLGGDSGAYVVSPGGTGSYEPPRRHETVWGQPGPQQQPGGSDVSSGRSGSAVASSSPTVAVDPAGYDSFADSDRRDQPSTFGADLEIPAAMSRDQSKSMHSTKSTASTKSSEELGVAPPSYVPPPELSPTFAAPANGSDPAASAPLLNIKSGYTVFGHDEASEQVSSGPLVDRQLTDWGSPGGGIMRRMTDWGSPGGGSMPRERRVYAAGSPLPTEPVEDAAVPADQADGPSSLYTVQASPPNGAPQLPPGAINAPSSPLYDARGLASPHPPTLYAQPTAQSGGSTWAVRSPREEGMHSTALEHQVLRQLTDDTQWDMVKEIKERGIDGGLDVTEVDGVPLTAVEVKMLAECSDDDRARFMAGAAAQRQGPPGIPGLGERATTSGVVSMANRTVPEVARLDAEPPATAHGQAAAASFALRGGRPLDIVDSTPPSDHHDGSVAIDAVPSGMYTLPAPGVYV